MSQSEGTISRALEEAREHLESLQSEVERYEQIVGSLEDAAELVNGASRQVKKQPVARKSSRPITSASEASMNWNEAIKRALGSDVLHTRKSLAQAALALRKTGSKGAAYQAMLYAMRSGNVSESNSGVLSWVEK